MSESHVLSGLKQKRAYLSGEVLVAQARIDKLRQDIAALDRTITLFDPDAKPSTIVPVIPRPRRLTFGRGGMTATALDILRKSEGPMTLRAIAEALAKQFSIPYEMPSDRIGLETRLRAALRKPRLGVVSEWNGKNTVWRPAD